MNFTMKIQNIRSINSIEGYWSQADYIQLLEAFDYPDAKNSDPAEFPELLEMAMNDYEPHESAEILLRYKLGDQLSSGQIRNLSHEMAEDDEAEDNPDMGLHYTLFNINQLLHRAYHGIFPNTKATIIDVELSIKSAGDEIDVSKEFALKAISQGLSSKSPLKRLFEPQLSGKAPFEDAEKIVWEIHHQGQNAYTIITSDYWINEEDIMEYEISGSIKEFEDPKD
ncbi:MAG: hypothetical protein K9M55_04775 [Candidatus Marinimicrobia bacterium]|nr:hypothetical protein [Candidatus Neomarinimicrobiota bacterium]